MTYQSGHSVCSAMIWKTPTQISSTENAWPRPAAMRVARNRSPLARQAIARAIRPPSIGKAGIRLNRNTNVLMAASQPNSTRAGVSSPLRRSVTAS